MNFVRHNYGFVVGVVLGLVLLGVVPFSLLLFTILGGIYDRRPDWLGMQAKKPGVDAWVERQLIKFSQRNSQ